MRKNSRTKNIIVVTIVTFIILLNSTKLNAATVKADTLNLRKEPSTSSSIVALLNQNDEIKILEEEGDWYKVTASGETGYVNKQYVNVSEEEINEIKSESQPIPDGNNIPTNSNQETTNQSQTITAKLSTNVTVKILPLINANTITTLNKEEVITIITKTNNWCFIQTDEISGWIVNTEITQETIEKPNNGEDNDNYNDNNNNSNTSLENIYSETREKYVSGSSIYVREEPSTSSNIVTTLVRNTDVTVIGENGDWYKVRYGTYNGYIYKELLSDSRIEETNRDSNSIDRQSNVSIVENKRTRRN